MCWDGAECNELCRKGDLNMSSSTSEEGSTKWGNTTTVEQCRFRDSDPNYLGL